MPNIDMQKAMENFNKNCASCKYVRSTPTGLVCKNPKAVLYGKLVTKTPKCELWRYAF